jgi:hypothetical protein
VRPACRAPLCLASFGFCRWPNADPELDLYPRGYNSAADTVGWVQAPLDMNTSVVHTPLPGNYAGMFQDFWWGIGGPCERFAAPPGGSYWCQGNGRVAGGTYFVRTPTGIVYDNRTLPNAGAYAADVGAAGGLVTWWRHGHCESTAQSCVT